ncbi:MAG: hypothetical protein JWO56_3412 [Acidobacteria bacterium]|nr:hypothetical protein [Acidobacteriota bacterium]
MIAIDTSSLRRFAVGERGDDTEAVRVAIATRQAAIPSIVVTEAYSDRHLDDATKAMLLVTPHLPLREGYWERVGLLRASVRMRGLKANIADCLIAQACIDHDIPLITYDRDFRHFAAPGLQLR